MFCVPVNVAKKSNDFEIFLKVVCGIITASIYGTVQLFFVVRKPILHMRHSKACL